MIYEQIDRLLPYGIITRLNDCILAGAFLMLAVIVLMQFVVSIAAKEKQKILMENNVE